MCLSISPSVSTSFHVIYMVALLFGAHTLRMASLVACGVQNPPTMQEAKVQPQGLEYLLENKVAIFSIFPSIRVFSNESVLPIR